MPNGTYSGLLNYSEDNNYGSASANVRINLKKSNVELIIDSPDSIVGHIGGSIQIPVHIYTSLGEDAVGDVRLICYSPSYDHSFELVDGKAIFDIIIPNSMSNYAGKIYIKYMQYTKSIDLEIVDRQNPIKKITQNDDLITVDLPGDAKGNVVININNHEFNASVIGGNAVIQITGLPNGTYTATVIYPGDGNYSNMTKVISVIVKNSDVKPSTPVYALTGSDINVLYTGNAAYKVLVTKDGKAVDAGENVVINFNGADTIVKTDANGYAVLKLNTGIKVGTYDVKVTYNGVTTTNKVTINHLIKAPNKKVKKSRKVTKIKITLKKVDGKFLKGKKLTIKLKGKKYTVKTNKKGVAKWKVKKSMLKKFKVGKKIKYTVTYGKDTLTKKLTIKK